MIKSAFVISAIALTLGLGTSLASIAQDTAVSAGPDVPASLKVPAGNQLFLHVYAKGIQIYRCVQDQKDTSRFSWIFVAPDADLYIDADYKLSKGKHYEGPTWESTDGSKVVGKKLQQADAPEPAAIPWLLLGVTSVTGAGTFSGTTFIQRINTHSGQAPPMAANRQHVGQEVGVQYTAEYLFYRAGH
jgi:hypothetical protein